MNKPLSIALILVAYQAEEHLSSCLASWIALKWGIKDDYDNNIKEPNKELDIKICAVSALFKEYSELFNLKYDNEKTSKILNNYVKSKAIEAYFEIDKPVGEVIDLVIFDRWGKQIFNRKNYDNRWNGTNLETGTYYYVVTVQGTKKTHKGWVEIVR